MKLYETIVGVLLAASLIFSAGWYYGAKFTDKRLSPEQIADNIEYIAFESGFPYMNSMDGWTIKKVKNMYKTYNMEGSTKPGRVLMESLATQICYKEVATDWNLELVDNTTVSYEQFMRCMINAEKE